MADIVGLTTLDTNLEYGLALSLLPIPSSTIDKLDLTPRVLVHNA
jgi:hypothetical protein